MKKLFLFLISMVILYPIVTNALTFEYRVLSNNPNTVAVSYIYEIYEDSIVSISVPSSIKIPKTDTRQVFTLDKETGDYYNQVTGLVFNTKVLSPDTSWRDSLPNVDPVIPDTSWRDSLPNIDPVIPDTSWQDTLPNIDPVIPDTSWRDSLPNIDPVIPDTSWQDTLSNVDTVIPDTTQSNVAPKPVNRKMAASADNITLEDYTVVSIEEKTFKNKSIMENLEQITLPETIENIDVATFENLDRLTSLTVQSKVVPTGLTVPSNVVLYVPQKSMEEYASAFPSNTINHDDAGASDNINEPIIVYVKDKRIYAEKILAIYNVVGRNVTTFNGRFQKGVYIVVTQQGVTKVIVR